jgi:CO dehydrogenase maturation factor
VGSKRESANEKTPILWGLSWMKLAISGKGGVGKTLLAALLIKEFVRNHFTVLAIDADPDTNLASALGFPHAEEITPISEMKELIEERTGAKPGQTGSLYKINPKVDDIPEKFAHQMDGIRLMVMGRVKSGGSGCYCPENTILQALIANLLVIRNEVVILDMAAGIEHLSRATARAVDYLIIVVEPGRKSLDTALRIKKMAQEINLNRIAIVGNKIRSTADREFIINNLPGFEFLGFLPYDASIIDADIANNLPVYASQPVIGEVRSIFQKLLAIV